MFKTVADEVDFNDTVDGVARVGNLGGDDDDVDEMFDDGEDVVEVVGAAFGEGMPSCASQDLSTWRVTIPSVAETPSGEAWREMTFWSVGRILEHFGKRKEESLYA